MKKNIIEIGTLCMTILLFLGGIYLFFTIQHTDQRINQLQEQQTTTNKKIEAMEQRLNAADSMVSALRENHERLKTEVSRQAARKMTVEVTAYDLSYESCGKSPGSPGYGVTASGFNLAGHSLESARAIAVDPSVIPLGSQVRLKFDDPEWSHLNGVYTAVDTGGAIGGNRIDLFFGEDGHYEALSFGRRTATLYFL